MITLAKLSQWCYISCVIGYTINEEVEVNRMKTIKDVANLAGVSVATVSRALNKSGYVSEKSRQKVELAIKELDFYPNEVARSLFQKKSKLIGLLLPDISNPFFPLVAKGVEDKINEKGYNLILGNVQEHPSKEIEYIRAFAQNNVAGVLSAVESSSNDFKNMPFVMLDRVTSNKEFSVHSDDYQGGMLAALAVSERKPGQVVVMVGPRLVSNSLVRLAGSLKILEDNNLDYQLLETESFQFDSAQKSAYQLFEKFPNVASVIASNDTHALSVMREAIRRGLSVPNDVQVVGYDDNPYSKLMYPSLSTIAQPAYQIGYQGAEILCNRIEGIKVDQTTIQLPVELKIRESLRKKEK